MKPGLLLAFALAGCAERALDHCLELDLAGGDFATDLAAADLSDLASSDLARPLCPAGARFIFTIDENRMLSRLNPDTLQFFDVGTIVCPAQAGAQPNSMAVARDGTGWVDYQSGELFRLDTMTVACKATPWVPGTGGLNAFGMSFAQSSPGSVDETLFVADNTQLASIDLSKFVLASQVGLGAGMQPELTGDDQANLWGFFPDLGGNTPMVAKLDKSTGQLGQTFMLPTLAGTAMDWAFAAWATDFYIFLLRAGDPSTRVYRLSSIDGSLSTAIANTGRRIVGVGAATCAADRGD